jgi:four helix bundle protein
MANGKFSNGKFGVAMGRLKAELLARIDSAVDRLLDVTEAIAAKRASPRVVDQFVGCATSIGANAWEADEALSRKDFCKCLGISIKEANESRFWLRLAARRRWIAAERVDSLHQEIRELQKVLGAIVTNTRRNAGTT